MNEEYDWQDVMIESFGSEWLKDSYDLGEIGTLAEIIAKLRNDKTVDNIEEKHGKEIR